jgi:hypothetical protein
MFRRIFVLLLLPVLFSESSPLSTQLCLCGTACAVATFLPRCAPLTAVYVTNNTQGTSTNWIGAVVSGGTPTNLSVSSSPPGAPINCTQSFFSIFPTAYNPVAILNATSLTQLSASVCQTQIPFGLASANTTLFLGLRSLNPFVVSSALVYASPPLGAVLYSLANTITSNDGLSIRLLISQVYNATGPACCRLPPTLAISTFLPTCTGLTATLTFQDPVTGAGEYAVQPLPPACARTTNIDIDGNTALGFSISIGANAAATGCPASAFFAAPNTTTFGVQLIPSPSSFSVSPFSFDFEPGLGLCPYSPAGFAQTWVLLRATSRCISTWSSAAFSAVAFSGVTASVGAPVYSPPSGFACPGTLVVTWNATSTQCFPTADLACGAVPFFTGTATLNFDGVVHTATATLALPSSCLRKPAAYAPSCVLNSTAPFFDPTAQVTAVTISTSHYLPTNKILLRSPLSVPGNNITFVPDTVVATWSTFSQGQALVNITYSVANASHAALFCRTGCAGSGTCAPLNPDDVFSFVPSDWGFPALNATGATSQVGWWDFAVSGAVRQCPAVSSVPPSLVPAASQFTSLASVLPQTPGCIPLTLVASAHLAVTATFIPNTNPGETLIASILPPILIVALLLFATFRYFHVEAKSKPRLAPVTEEDGTKKR